MDNLFYMESRQALCMALLEEEKFIESANLFNQYLCEIRNMGTIFWKRKEKEAQLSYICSLYVSKLVKKAEEYFKKEDWAKLVICYGIAQNYNKYLFEDINIIKNYIQALIKTQQNELVPDFIEQYKILIQDNVAEYKELANIYYLSNDSENAIKYIKKYVDSKPKDELTGDDYNLVGFYNSYRYSNHDRNNSLLEEAAKYFKIAHEKNPVNKLYINNITIMLSLLNNYEEAKCYWDKLLELGELSEDERFEYSAYCLKMGDFENWYNYYDARFHRKKSISFPKIEKPLWDGKNHISNKKLLVYFEQGFGDTILMWGYNKRLLKIVPNIIWVVQDAIYPLLKYNDLNIPVYPAGAIDINTLNFDFYIPSMDIPKVLKINRDNASVGENYINVRSEKVEYYKNSYFSNDKVKIGISFSGNNTGNQTRNIPINVFEMLDDLDNVEIYSLIKDVDDKLFDNFKKNKVHNVAKCFDNFEDTAAIMKNLDIVITADNVILNLAGALGIKTYALFNFCYEFRWYNLNDNNVGWYTSVKPYINQENDGWIDTMKKVVSDIKADIYI